MIRYDPKYPTKRYFLCNSPLDPKSPSNYFSSRYWGLAIQLLTIFSSASSKFPKGFAKVNTARYFPSRFFSGEL